MFKRVASLVLGLVLCLSLLSFGSQASATTVTTLSDMSVGDTVLIYEQFNSDPPVAIPYVVAKHDYESTLNGSGRTLLVRMKPYTSMAWANSTSNEYSGSLIDTYLNGSFKSMLPSLVQTEMGTTIFYYSVGDSSSTSVSKLRRSIFLLSLTEFGGSSTWYYNKEGTALPQAARAALSNRLGGVPTDGGSGYVVSEWTRTPVRGEEEYSIYLVDGGTQGVSRDTGYEHAIRPCFTLPDTLAVTSEGVVDGSYPFTVTFKDWDGTVLKTESVSAGNAATAPADPTRDNYVFMGWNQSFSSVTSNLVITAQYELNVPVTLEVVSDAHGIYFSGDYFSPASLELQATFLDDSVKSIVGSTCSVSLSKR